MVCLSDLVSITDTRSQSHTVWSFLKALDQTLGCLSCEDLKSNYLDSFQEISMEIIPVCPVQNNIRIPLSEWKHLYFILSFFFANYACITLVSDFIFLLKVHWLCSQNNEVHSLALIDDYYNKIALA